MGPTWAQVMSKWNLAEEGQDVESASEMVVGSSGRVGARQGGASPPKGQNIRLQMLRLGKAVG